MVASKIWRQVFAFAFSALAMGVEQPHDIAADNWWLPGTEPVGVGGMAEVSVLKRCDNRVVVCGNFSGIGTAPAKGIAFFDGKSWSGLPDTPDHVFDSCPHPAGGWLILGAFHKVGGVTVHGAARWDGSAWTSQGFSSNFMGDQAWSLKSQTIIHGGYETQDKDGTSLLSQEFWRWDGTKWAPWPVQLTGGNPAKLHLIDRQDGSLIIAGSFTAINGVQFSNIAEFKGDAWHPLGAGLPWYFVLGLLEDADGCLIAWGAPKADAPGPSVLRWDGTSWKPPAWLPSGARIVEGIPLSPNAVSRSTGATVSAAASAAVFVVVQPDEQHHSQERILRVARGSATSVTAGLVANVEWLAEAPDGKILLLGDGLGIPGSPACGAAWWDGASLSAAFPSCGSDGAVNCITEAHDGSLILGGSFSRCAGAPASCIARVAPNGCSAIAADFGSGLTRAAPDEDGERVRAEVTALAESPDGSVVVAGAFDHAGTLAANGVARWTGRAWTTLGELGSGTRCLATLDADRVVAGGAFRTTSDTHHLLCWDGRTWSPLGADPDDDVCDVKVDTNGSLMIVGFFSHIGNQPFAHAARWDGAHWHALGSGLDDMANALTRHPTGGWVVSGRFTHAGGHATRHVAHWDGTSWTAMGDGFDEWPSCMATWKDCVIAGNDMGLFDRADGFSHALAIWQDGRWQPLGTGVAWASALCIDRTGTLHVGGRFGSAGARAAGNWGRFNLRGYLAATAK